MSDSATGVLIVGGGAAGHACAAKLRTQGFDGPVRVLDAEPDRPINRTLVDTGVLPGLLTPEQIQLHPVAGVDLIAGRAVGLNMARRSVTLADGRELRADALVLASGSVPRGLGPATTVARGSRVYQLHTAADALALRAALPDPARTRIAILGSGFIGAEVASHFRAAGSQVLLLGRSAQPLRAAVGTRIAEQLAELHRDRVDARFGSDLVAVEPGRGARAVTLTLGDGTREDVDVLVVAQGTVPATDWAQAAGGIRVDLALRVVGATSVYAAGSAAVLSIDGSPMRIDHWDDAAAQGAHAARTILHDLQGAEDPGAYLPRAGFTLQVYGTVIAARGIRPAQGSERDAAAALELEPSFRPEGLLTEHLHRDGSRAGVAGYNAGAALVRLAAGIGSGA